MEIWLPMNPFLALTNPLFILNPFWVMEANSHGLHYTESITKSCRIICLKALATAIHFLLILACAFRGKGSVCGGMTKNFMIFQQSLNNTCPTSWNFLSGVWVDLISM